MGIEKEDINCLLRMHHHCSLFCPSGKHHHTRSSNAILKIRHVCIGFHLDI
jgi:hypothetical protein